MQSKPKNFSQALDELEKLTDKDGVNFKAKLHHELSDLEEKIQRLRPQLDELKNRAQEELGKTKEKVEVQVRENPWAAIGIVGLIFFVLGLLFGSRRSD